MDNAGTKTWRERIGAGKDYQLHAATDVERAMVAEISEQGDAILALHRQLAAEKLRADQGWERAEAKSRECIELRERMAIAGASDVGPALDRAAVLTEAVALLPAIMAETFKRNDCTEEFLNGMAYGAATYCSAIKSLADPARPDLLARHRWADVGDKPAGGAAQTQGEAKGAGAAQTCRSSEKVQVHQQAFMLPTGEPAMRDIGAAIAAASAEALTQGTQDANAPANEEKNGEMDERT